MRIDPRRRSGVFYGRLAGEIGSLRPVPMEATHIDAKTLACYETQAAIIKTVARLSACTMLINM